MDDIPAEFIQRQLNDSRYISKVMKGLLSNIVRTTDEDGNLEREAISKNVITCNGSVTTRLKRDWGLGEVWNAIVLPRFQRLNEITGRDCFTALNSHGQEIPAMPLELQKGFSIKRIDHRHHIACVIQAHGIERIRIVQVGTDNEIGTAAHHSRYHESHPQANHAHALADGRLAERQPDGIKSKTIDHD